MSYTKARDNNYIGKQNMMAKLEGDIVEKAKIQTHRKNAGTKEKENKGSGDKNAFKLKRFFLFSIRNKIFICFLVPIGFMIAVGVSAYQKASEGMSEKFRESTMQTIKMATEYIDMSDTFIEAEGMKYAFDSDLGKYYLGMYENDPMGKMKVTSNVKTTILASQTSNPFISNIHIVTKDNVNMISTKNGSNSTGIFNAYRDEMQANYGDSKKLQKWVDRHSALDEALGIKDNDYILSYQTYSQNNNAIVVIDVKESAIRDFLSGLSLGNGSILGFVTENGREVICENLEAGQNSSMTEGEPVFFQQDFYKDSLAGEALFGTGEVKYQGQDYLYLFSRSEKNYSTVAALVPFQVVTGQAEEIKGITVRLVILACIVAVLIGVVITTGIQNNMKRISKKLGEVAKGDLTVQVKVRGRDEFRNLAFSATNMIQNNKKLVAKVSGATGELENSAREVKEASGIISDYSSDITDAIGGINEGMSRQSKHAQECVERADILSNEIQEVSRVVEKVEKLVGETENMITKGMDIVKVLGERASETTTITAKVGTSIAELKAESEIINNFVETINGISEQTNLLSLNASIEAARAGEAGRGFAVVAEEIRKLADDSSRAAGEIRVNVEHISSQTKNSVDSARQAESMVALQSEAVEEVVVVFREMNQRMTVLVKGLKDIVESMEKADRERNDTLVAVRNISEIIEETASSAEVVNDVASRLMKNVENLNKTADALGGNMNDLKTEISVFKTE